MLKVMLIHSSAGLYGGESVIINLAQALGTRGYHPLVVSIEAAADRLSPFAAACREEGLDLALIVSSAKFSPAAIAHIMRLIRRRRVDILHSHSYKSTILGTFAARLTGIPLIETNHLFPPMPLSDRKLQTYARVGAFFLRFAQQTVAVSEKVKRELAACGVPAHKIVVIENGISLAKYRAIDPAQRAQVKQRLGLPPDRFLIGGIGRLTEQKGFAYLLEAAARICPRRPQVMILIAGEGALKDQLKDQARRLGVEAQVRFIGFRRDIVDIMSIMDVFTMPSIDEGLPMAMLEAMAVGVPVVLTRVGEIPRVIAHRRNGLLVQPADAAGLADALMALIDQPDLGQRLSAAALRTVRAGYSNEAMSDRYIRLYERIAAHTHQPSQRMDRIDP